MKNKVNSFMKEIIKAPLLRERQFKYLIISAYTAALINSFYIIFSAASESKIFPIRYNFLYEITQTGKTWTLLFMPLLAVVLISGNVLIAHYFYNKDRLVTYIFLSVNILFVILIFLQSIALINLGKL